MTLRLSLTFLVATSIALAACGGAKRSGGSAPVTTQPPANATAPLGVSAKATATGTPASGPIDVIWSIDGSPNKLSFATRLAMDHEDNLYVLDNESDRVQKFDSNGKFLTMWGSRGSGDAQFIVSCPTRDCPPACTGGACFHLPGALTTDDQGNVYVVDYTGRVQKFDGNGTLLRKFGGKGNGDGQFDTPFGIAVDKQGNIYVGDVTLNRVEKFDPAGTFPAAWGTEGNGDGQFEEGGSIALDSEGDVYVADMGNNRIEKFDNTGKFLMTIGDAGPKDGQLTSVEGMRVGSDGSVWVLENVVDRIHKFGSSGRSLGIWGSEGSGAGQSVYTGDIAIDSAGNFYVVDLLQGIVADSSRIRKLQLR